MRRTRRHKLIQVSTFFLVYFIFYVYSEKLGNKDELTIKKVDEPKPNVTILPSPQGTKATREIITTSTRDPHPTLRPKRENCTPPAIEQVGLRYNNCYIFL